MADTLQPIRDAITEGDIARARALLSDALRSPTAETYVLAARVAADTDQRKRMLQRALELDPFNLEAAHALQETAETPKDTPATKPLPNNAARSSPRNGLSPVLIAMGGLALVFVSCVGAYWLFNRSPSNSYPTDRPATRRPAATPTPKPTSTPTVSTYSIDVSGDVSTDLKLAVGDEVTINATGSITTGLIGYKASPDGVSESAEFWLSSYSLDQNFRHGALLYGLSGDAAWSLCGSRCEFVVIGQGGYLSFTINDAKKGDNSGTFHVTITITHR